MTAAVASSIPSAPEATTNTQDPPAASRPIVRAVDDRGALTIAEQVVERIVIQVVAESGDIGGTARTLFGMSLDSADLDRGAKAIARIRGGTVSLEVRLSVAYPASVARATDQARARITARVTELTGLAVSRTDIVVTAVRTPHTRDRRLE